MLYFKTDVLQWALSISNRLWQTVAIFIVVCIASSSPWRIAQAQVEATQAPETQQATMQISDNIIFVTSTGYWEESDTLLDPDSEGVQQNKEVPEQTTPTEKQAPRQRGYYKLLAVRQPEGNMHIVLQQIALGVEGPKVVSSAELEEFSSMKAYVTDIRPESSDGVSNQPGLFATVYLKTDPSSPEPETWTVLIDDVGDIKVERATN